MKNFFEEFQEAVSEAVNVGHERGALLDEKTLAELEFKTREIVDKRLRAVSKKAAKATATGVNFTVGIGQMARTLGKLF